MQRTTLARSQGIGAGSGAAQEFSHQRAVLSLEASTHSARGNRARRRTPSSKRHPSVALAARHGGSSSRRCCGPRPRGLSKLLVAARQALGTWRAPVWATPVCRSTCRGGPKLQGSHESSGRGCQRVVCGTAPQAGRALHAGGRCCCFVLRAALGGSSAGLNGRGVLGGSSRCSLAAMTFRRKHPG